MGTQHENWVKEGQNKDRLYVYRNMFLNNWPAGFSELGEFYIVILFVSYNPGLSDVMWFWRRCNQGEKQCQIRDYKNCRDDALGCIDILKQNVTDAMT